MTQINQIIAGSSFTGEHETEYYPITPLTAGESIQFDIPESTTQLTDPNFFLKIKAKIVEGDGTVLKDNAAVAPVNLTLHSLFRDIVLKANGTIISQATGTYSYRAYIETNYTYSSPAKNGAIGLPQCYIKETAGKFNAVTLASNTSFDKRVNMFAKSKEVEMGGRIHCDIFLQKHLIVPGVNFSITLIPSTKQFHLMSGTANAAEKLVITKIVLKVRRLNITSSCLLNIERSLEKTPFEYAVRHAVVRTAHVSAGQSMISNYIISNGQIPRIVIITFLQASAFQGDYMINPYNFSLKRCQSAQVSVNGKLVPPLPYTPKSSMIDVYLNCLKMVNKFYADTDNSLNFEDFQENGHPILPFDLFPHEAGISPKTNGVVTFTGQWGPADFDDNYIMVYYLLYDNVISIDSRKNLILDYIP